MNIILVELKANRKALIIWTLGIMFMVFAGMGKYAGMSNTDQSLNEIMDKLPRSLQIIWGTEGFDLTKASGFYGILFLYLMIMSTIHAAMLGATILSKEERDNTAEFLIVKPVSRYQIISAKLITSLVNLVVINLVTLISSVVFVNYLSEGENVTGDILLLMVALFILQLIYLTLGLALASICKKPKLAPSITTGIVLFTFLLSIIINFSEKLTWLKYLTPFKYFEAKNIIYGGGLDLKYSLLSLLLISIFLVITYIFYSKRDLNV